MWYVVKVKKEEPDIEKDAVSKGLILKSEAESMKDFFKKTYPETNYKVMQG